MHVSWNKNCALLCVQCMCGLNSVCLVWDGYTCAVKCACLMRTEHVQCVCVCVCVCVCRLKWCG